MVSVWRGFLFLWVLGMGYVILLWYSLSLPYNYFSFKHKITIEKSRSRLSVSDTLVTIHNRQLHTDIYYKPTDSKQYLLYPSCHPKHTRNSIPYNLAIRLKMIVSDENYLLKQRYPPALIDDSIRKIKALNRPDLLKIKKTIQDSNLIPYGTTFNPHNPEVYPDIEKNKSLLLKEERMQTIFSRKIFLKSKRQSPNLKKILTKAKFSKHSEMHFEVTKCNVPRCGLCKYLKEGSTFDLKGLKFSVSSNMDCTVRNVILCN